MESTDCHILDTQGISVDGCDDIIGSDAFFYFMKNGWMMEKINISTLN